MDLATLGIRIDNSQVQSSTVELNRLGQVGDNVSARLTRAFAAFSAGFSVFATIRKFVEETSAAQAAQAQLEAAVRSTGGAAGVTVQQMQALGAELQRTTKFSDEAVAGAQAILLTFKRIRGDQFREATVAVADLAARMGGDLQSAASQLGKALQDPVSGLTMLRRVGVTFTDSQERTIKALAETNRYAEAQALILRELNTQFGGSAAAARDTLGGALAGLRNDFGELFEVSRTGSAGLVTAINAVATGLRLLKDNMGEVVRVGVTLAAFFGGRWLAGAAQGLAAYVASLALARTATQAWAAENARNATLLQGQLLVEREALVARQAALQQEIAATGATKALRGQLVAVNAALQASEVNLAGSSRDFAQAQQALTAINIGYSTTRQRQAAIEAAVHHAELLAERETLLARQASLQALIAEGGVSKSVRGQMIAVNAALATSEVNLAASTKAVAATQTALTATTSRLGAVSVAVSGLMGSLAAAARTAWAAIGGPIGLAVAAAAAFLAYQDKILQKMGLLPKNLGEQTEAQNAATEAAIAATQARRRQVEEETQSQFERLRAARNFIRSLKEEADLFGLSAAEARRYKVANLELNDAGAKLTATEQALAMAEVERLNAKERIAELDERLMRDAQTAADGEMAWQDRQLEALRDAEEFNQQRIIDENELAKSVLDTIATLQTETDTFNRQAAVLGKSKQVRDQLRVQLAGEAAVRQAVAAAQQKMLFLTDQEIKALREAAEARERATIAAEATPQQEALNHAKALADTIGQAVTGGLQLADAFGVVGTNAAKVLDTVTQIATASNTLDKALKAKSTADILSSSLAIAGGVSSLLGGLFGESESERRRREATDKNTEAIRELKDTIGNFGLSISGTDFLSAQRGIGALLANPVKFLNGTSGFDRSTADRILRGNGSSLQELRELADQLGITLNTDSFVNFVTSLKELDEAIKNTELTKFADTFTGRMQALNAQWEVFNTTDPLKRLVEQLAEASRLNLRRKPNGGGFELVGTGSPAFRAAGAGLDLSTAAGRNQLLLNLQGLFTRLQAGALAPGELGGLTADQFLEQLTSMIGLLREVEAEAAKRDQELSQVADNLRKFSDSLKLSALSVLSPIEQLAEARRQYNALLVKAQAGDLAAAANVPEAARALLEASRAVNASGPAYAADFAAVTSQAETLAAMLESQRSLGQQQLEAAQATATNTQTAAEALQALVGVTAEGQQALIDRIEELTVEMAELKRATKQGFEGNGL